MSLRYRPAVSARPLDWPWNGTRVLHEILVHNANVLADCARRAITRLSRLALRSYGGVDEQLDIAGDVHGELGRHVLRCRSAGAQLKDEAVVDKIHRPFPSLIGLPTAPHRALLMAQLLLRLWD